MTDAAGSDPAGGIARFGALLRSLTRCGHTRRLLLSALVAIKPLGLSPPHITTPTIMTPLIPPAIPRMAAVIVMEPERLLATLYGTCALRRTGISCTGDNRDHGG